MQKVKILGLIGHILGRYHAGSGISRDKWIMRETKSEEQSFQFKWSHTLKLWKMLVHIRWLDERAHSAFHAPPHLLPSCHVLSTLFTSTILSSMVTFLTDWHDIVIFPAESHMETQSPYPILNISEPPTWGQDVSSVKYWTQCSWSVSRFCFPIMNLCCLI